MTSKKLTEKPLKRRRFMKTAVGLTLAPIAIGLWGCGGSNSTSTVPQHLTPHLPITTPIQMPNLKKILTVGQAVARQL
tara:strand:- start:2 stop:235 length:234 start_codon:yes stop_codon:yes gene_type:complete